MSVLPSVCRHINILTLLLVAIGLTQALVTAAVLNETILCYHLAQNVGNAFWGT